MNSHSMIILSLITKCDLVKEKNVTFLAVMTPKHSEMVVLFAVYVRANFYVDRYGYCEEMIFWICSLIFLYLSYSHELLKSAQKQLNKRT